MDFDSIQSKDNIKLYKKKLSNIKIKFYVKTNITNLDEKMCMLFWLNDTVFEPYPNPKNSPFEAWKAKIDPKVRPKLKVSIEKT